MKIEMGIGWVPSEEAPYKIRSANPGEYAAEIVRLRSALEHIANLPSGDAGFCRDIARNTLNDGTIPAPTDADQQ